MTTLKLAFLGSTKGTTFKALWPQLKKDPNLCVSLVIANRPCGFLEFAIDEGLPHHLITSKGRTRAEFEEELMRTLNAQNIDLVVLTGFMRLLSRDFTDKWQERTINVHPSLLPKHKGLMDLFVHQAVLNQQETLTGCSVHLVTENVDGGKVLQQETCKVYPGDRAEDLKKRVQALEPIALLKAIHTIFETCQEELI
jgi:formyltetrahydrofolate-dependent phosphoribosylglycinamide formyltransferase